MEKGEENRDSVEEHFAVLAFLEAFLESKDEDNDFDTASEVLWSAFEKICLRQDFVNRMFFLAHPSWLHETPCCDMLSDASVNFHFDATRSFHLKIGKIKFP